ncbi:hypothetical protein MJD09_12735, partial [bacterium]|nr:hypothetical protein [bacterium]
MVKEKEAFLVNVIKVVDALTIVVAFVCSYFLSVFIRDYYSLGAMAYAAAPNLEGLSFFARKNLAILLSSLPIWIFLLSIQGAYKELRARNFSKELSIIIKAALLATVAQGSLIFLLKLTLTSRLYIGINAGVTICLLIGQKLLMHKFFDYFHRKGYNQINILIVGTGKRAQQFIKVVKDQAHWGLRIVGLIDDEHGMFGKEIEGYRVLGRLQDIPFILHRIVVDRVIFVVPRLWLHRIDEAILACER